MRIEEAYNLLECLPDVSDEDLKAKHKELVFKYHPDRNKDQPNKLSEINSAYTLIKEYRENPSKFQPPMPGFGFDISEIFQNIAGHSFNRQSPSPQVSLSILFKESILGAEKEIKYKRQEKCGKCEGKGVEILGNGCKKCNGKGRIMQQQPGMIFSSTCDSCHGRNMKTNKCVPCNAKGTIEQEVSTGISIPAGVIDNSNLMLAHAGNFLGNQMFGESYGNVNINVRVQADKDLTLVGDDVVSNLSITLLEALEGCKKKIRTIFDERDIEVKAGFKHLEEIELEKCGVPTKNGVQRIIVSVEYPGNIKGLIEYLRGDVK